jgi:SAM-dependent methyltransferase
VKSSKLGDLRRRLFEGTRRRPGRVTVEGDRAPDALLATPDVRPMLGGREVVSFDEIDGLLRRADDVELSQGYAEKARFLDGFRLDPWVSALPEDPDSPEYRLAQMSMYRKISGVDDYDPRIHEIVPMDIDARVRQPAPFHEGSSAAVGEHLIAYGFLLRLLALSPGASVIEYGPGNGNIALLLATAGMRVTAIDIGPDYIEIIRRRAENQGVAITAVVGEFGDPSPDGDPVDAIVFYEAFHHSADHHGLLAKLKRRLAPGGKLVLAAEPILEDASRPWAGPWGVRLDGISLSAMRAYRCLELGFSESYFVRSLMRQGFVVRHHLCRETALGNAWVAAHSDGIVRPNQVTLPPDEGATWGPGDADPAMTHRYTTDSSRVTLDEDEAWDALRVEFTNFLPTELAATACVGAVSGYISVLPGTTAALVLELPVGRRELIISSQLASPAGSDQTPLGLAVNSIEMLDSAAFHSLGSG